MRRVLLAERISADRGERSESIESQHDKLTRHAAAEGVTVVGVAQDLSVSGDVDPFTRKSLGPWLTEENRGKWDELWVTTQDRLSRNDEHTHEFLRRVVRQWGKKVVILDNPNLDFHTPAGRAIAYVQSIGPAMELDRIRTRIKDSHERRRFTTRWGGGIPPFGYRPVSRFVEGKTATYLEQDPAMVAVLHEMRRQILTGQSFFAVAKDLNAKGEHTARDRARLRRGKPVHRRGAAEGVPEQWSAGTVKNLLKDPALLGYKKHKGEVLYDSQGQPIQLADPVFDEDEWQSLQTAVEARTKTTVRRVNGTSPLYGVVWCGECGSKAAHKGSIHGGVEYRYYVCGAWPKEDRCRGVSVRAEEVEGWVEIYFLERYGDQPVMERVWVQGTDNTKELEEVRKRIDRLRRDSVAGLWEDDQEGFRSLMASLMARRDELAAQPVVEGHWSEVPTGQTFQQLWAGLDLEGKRLQLAKSGYRVEVGRKTFAVTPEPETPAEVLQRLRAEGADEQALEEVAEVLRKTGHLSGE